MLKCTTKKLDEKAICQFRLINLIMAILILCALTIWIVCNSINTVGIKPVLLVSTLVSSLIVFF
jgi:hypothetical protein